MVIFRRERLIHEKQGVSQMRKYVVIFFVGIGILLSFPQSSSAQWEQAGRPKGGWITALAVSGKNQFAGTEASGIFLSTNSGADWTAVNSGLPENTSVPCLAMRGANLFAGTNKLGVWRLPLSDITSKK